VTSNPILLDGDTGYGNFNNLRRLVRKLEQRHVAGVCIEDKEFPKTNSFIDGERQPLADIDEFCGKIKAGKDVQGDQDFCIVARVEALILGWGMREALRRAEAYRSAGADGILIHSKLTRPDEILEFAREWAGRAPLVIVPTTYYSTPTDVFRRAGISVVIWANQMIRAAVAAMEQVSASIKTQQSVAGVEDRIASVNHIFALQGAEELSAAQDRYLKPPARTQAIVLAASRGNALHELTADRPKVMISVGGKPLLRRLTEEFKRQNIGRVVVVAGYKADAIDVGGIEIIRNSAYETTGELTSLACAADRFEDDLVILYGDLLFRGYILRDLLDSPGDLVVVVDSALEGSRKTGTADLAWCSRPDDRSLFRDPVQLLRIEESDFAGNTDPPSGRWIGMLRARGAGRSRIMQAMSDLRAQQGFDRRTLPDLLNHLIRTGHPVQVHYIHGHWLDVNQLDDLDRAGDFTQGLA
ncbi:MAG: isocitrate lyase/phosphoenolpyruvate mutase family protein, partial [Gammaproteobacteria bacterium]|nr:isocitrate lyase/phosphoenolpyruvate mutase family protein [Gammaproteobacteria bacterium]